MNRLSVVDDRNGRQRGLGRDLEHGVLGQCEVDDMEKLLIFEYSAKGFGLKYPFWPKTAHPFLLTLTRTSW